MEEILWVFFTILAVLLGAAMVVRVLARLFGRDSGTGPHR